MTKQLQEPLRQWICDACGEPIRNANEGYVEWLTEGDDSGRIAHGFRIVHNAGFSPRRKSGGDCYKYSSYSGRADLPLRDFLKHEGVALLLTFLDLGPIHDPSGGTHRVKNMREYVELFRRVQLPYYEEARQLWGIASANGFFDSANELRPYLPSTLKEIAERYSQ